MKKLFTLFLGMLLCARLLAGDPVWKAKFTSTVNWQKVTPLGLLVVSANDGFYGVDNATGQVKWKIDFLTDLKEENYERDFRPAFLPHPSDHSLSTFRGIDG